MAVMIELLVVRVEVVATCREGGCVLRSILVGFLHTFFVPETPKAVALCGNRVGNFYRWGFSATRIFCKLLY